MNEEIVRRRKFVALGAFLTIIFMTSILALGEIIFQNVKYEFFPFVHERFSSEVRRRADQQQTEVATHIPVNLPSKAEKGGRYADVKAPPLLQTHHPADFFDFDEFTGHYIRPNFTGFISQTNGMGEETYRIFLKMDSKRRRYTAHQDEIKREETLLFFGCSFIFGEGLEQDQTLPSQMAERLKNYKVFNYGFPAAGPNNMLKIIQKPGFGDDLSTDRKVKVIYLYIDHHINRVIGSLDIYQLSALYWAKILPSFKIDEGSHLIATGTHWEGDLGKVFYRFLAHSALVKKSGVRLPLFIDDSDMRLVSLVIANMKSELQKKFHNLDFYVAINPGTTGKFLIPYLDELGIASIDYSKVRIGQYVNGNPQTVDGHPTGIANAFLAEQLIRDLKLK